MVAVPLLVANPHLRTIFSMVATLTCVNFLNLKLGKKIHIFFHQWNIFWRKFGENLNDDIFRELNGNGDYLLSLLLSLLRFIRNSNVWEQIHITVLNQEPWDQKTNRDQWNNLAIIFVLGDSKLNVSSQVAWKTRRSSMKALPEKRWPVKRPDQRHSANLPAMAFHPPKLVRR